MEWLQTGRGARAAKRAGAAVFAFFLVKGLVWVAVLCAGGIAVMR